MNKSVRIAFVICIVIAVTVIAYAAGVYVRSTKSAQVAIPTQTSETADTATVPSETAPKATTDTAERTQATYTAAQVAAHASATDCWLIVSGKVYGATSFISQHPGGAKAITRECGKDATAVFTGEEAHKRPETATILAQLYVGDLAR